MNTAAFSPGGECIVTASDDRTARVWRADGTGPVLVLRGHRGEVSSAAWSLYSLMLRLLGWATEHVRVAPLSHELARLAIQLMTMVIRPLGEALTLVPSGLGAGSRAGAPFGLTRHVTLPADARTAKRAADERLQELANRAGALAQEAWAPSRLVSAAQPASAERREQSLSGYATPFVSLGRVIIAHGPSAEAVAGRRLIPS